MQISEKTYDSMPKELRYLFNQEPNPARHEVVEGFPVTSGGGASTKPNGTGEGSNCYGEYSGTNHKGRQTDKGSAARFFYCAKASKKDRGDGNSHPTVKPTDLMRYLCRLITPPGGAVLDPFMGSGSTGKAAVLEGFHFTGIELEAEYVAISQRRIGAVL